MKEKYGLMPEHVETGWENYPRPQFQRDSFFNLNGLWKVSGQDVLIPFCLQSKKSGFEGAVPEEFTYERRFTLPEDFIKDMVLLNFGAVDQVAQVYVNGQYVGMHEGGYLPFQLDVTSAINRGENVISVQVKDKLSHYYPYGKQKTRRGGMWYTPVSGIWQSVWLESVPAKYIRRIKITPDLTGIDLTIDTNASACQVEILCGDYREQYQYNHLNNKNNKIRLDIQNPKCWTCENPVLYQLRIRVIDNISNVMKKKDNEYCDEIRSYFALRVIGFEEINDVQRLCLNHKPIFLNGVLDQGYFCDGIYTPSNEQEYERDILRMKELGFNVLRKHIKIEPEVFYFDCDRLGMLVIQDMVNSGHYSFFWDTVMPTFITKRAGDSFQIRSRKRKRFFVEHTKETIKHLYNHPSIIGYTIFNEGWGQFDSDRIFGYVKKWDSTRIVDATSGWFKQKYSDVESEHVYFKNIVLHPERKKPMFLSECGGFQYTIKEHVSTNRVYGYGGCNNQKELMDKISSMYTEMVIPAMKDGLCGCIYTQLSDVEDEVNGLYTYDRKICKVVPEQMRMLSEKIVRNLDEYL